MKIKIKDKEFITDDEGYLIDSTQFCEDWVEYIRTQEKMEELTDLHYKVLVFIRGYYEEFHKVPGIRVISRGTDLFMKDIFKLFPTNISKGGCKMAGVPKPCGCC